MLPADVLRALPAGAGARGALRLRHRRARHPGRTRRRRGRAGRADLLRRAARGAEATRPTPSRLSFDWFGRSLHPAEPPPDPALRRGAGGQRLHRGADRPDGLFASTTGASCPTAMSRAPARTAPTPRRAATSATTAARLLDPTDLIEPYSGVSGSREPGGARHPPPLRAADQAAGPHPRLGGQQDRVPRAHPLHRLQAPGRGADRPRHHPRPGLGHPGDQGRLSAARASRTRSSTSGSTRPSNTSAPPSSGPSGWSGRGGLGALVAARPGRRRRPLRRR